MKTKSSDETAEPRASKENRGEPVKVDASKVGVTLRLSQETLRKYDRMQAKRLAAAKRARRFTAR